VKESNGFYHKHNHFHKEAHDDFDENVPPYMYFSGYFIGNYIHADELNLNDLLERILGNCITDQREALIQGRTLTCSSHLNIHENFANFISRYDLRHNYQILTDDFKKLKSLDAFMHYAVKAYDTSFEDNHHQKRLKNAEENDDSDGLMMEASENIENFLLFFEISLLPFLYKKV
jgi:hypothetical protein